MSEKAHLTSIEALEELRVALLIFTEKASLVLEEVSEEVKRSRIWLESGQAPALTRLHKQRLKELEMLQQELYTARLSNLVTERTGHKQRVTRKKRQIQQLEDTMRNLKGWIRNFDSVVQPAAKKVDKLRSVIDSDMGRAVNFLAQSTKSLEAYSESGGGSSPDTTDTK